MIQADIRKTLRPPATRFYGDAHRGKIMEETIAQIGEKWEAYGLFGVYRDEHGSIVLDDDGRLGPYWFGVAGDLECLFGRPLYFVDMPGHGELVRLWEAKNGR